MIESSEVKMDVTVKLELESESDGDDPLCRDSSEQECSAPNTVPAEEHVFEVPIMNIIKCEYESGSEHDDEPKPAERDIGQGGAVQKAEPHQQQQTAETAIVQAHQPGGDTATAPEINRRHQCTICHKFFSSTSVLRKHWRQHTGEKPYGCDICHRRFTHNSSFRRHLVTHTGEKPYECSICQNRFTQESSLRTHLRTHTDEKPFECNICHKHFARKYHLEEHSRVHTADKPYACHICQRRFTRKFSLGKHLRSRCGEDILLLFEHRVFGNAAKDKKK